MGIRMIEIQKRRSNLDSFPDCAERQTRVRQI